MKQKLTIGLKNYTGPACTFAFNESIAIVDVPDAKNVEEHAAHNRNVERLKALFQGTTAEMMGEDIKAQPVPAKQEQPAAPAKVEAKIEAAKEAPATK